MASLEDERKEFEMTIKELKEENKKLKSKSPNEDEWEHWGSEQLIAWIVTIDPEEYGKYEEGLRKTFGAENVTGA